MSEFNFKSQICTTREQSERLLALGLKKETADMAWWSRSVDWCGIVNDNERRWHLNIRYVEAIDARMETIPAWSLHRLWCLLPRCITIVTHFEYGRQYKAGLDLTMDSYQNVCYLEGVDQPCYDMSFFANDAYESICKAIEWLIKEGYFNKEYLWNDTNKCGKP